MYEIGKLAQVTSEMKLYNLHILGPSGRVVHCYNFKLMTSPGIIFSTQCIIFQFHEKERPVPSNVNRSQEHRFLEGNEKKKKTLPFGKCHVM